MSTTSKRSTQLREALAELLGSREFHALHEPRFAGQEWSMVKECLDTGWVSSAGAYVDRFEADLAKYCGARHAVAMVNGTAALHIGLLVAGVHAGDEVLVPALTFVATANAVRHAGAFPHFVEAQEETLGVDPVALRSYLQDIVVRREGTSYNRATQRRISAIVPMHTFGHPVDMDKLAEVAKEFGLKVIEDAAEALGSRYKGRQCGGLGNVGVLSFNGNKIITTGGGGALLTNDADMAARAKHLSTTAKLPHRWEFDHDEVAFNYRMPNLNAALGCAQLEQLPGFLEAKRSLADSYRKCVSHIEGLRFVQEPEGSQSNYWLQAILLDAHNDAERDEVLSVLNDAGMQCRPVWKLLNRLPMYQDCPSMPLPVAERLERGLINLPSSSKLGIESAA